MFWSNCIDDNINQANLDGSNHSIVVANVITPGEPFFQVYILLHTLVIV